MCQHVTNAWNATYAGTLERRTLRQLQYFYLHVECCCLLEMVHECSRYLMMFLRDCGTFAYVASSYNVSI